MDPRVRAACFNRLGREFTGDHRFANFYVFHWCHTFGQQLGVALVRLIFRLYRLCNGKISLLHRAVHTVRRQ